MAFARAPAGGYESGGDACADFGAGGLSSAGVTLTFQLFNPFGRRKELPWIIDPKNPLAGGESEGFENRRVKSSFCFL